MTITKSLSALLIAAASTGAAHAQGIEMNSCEGFVVNARNTYPPYEETIRTYADGAIRLIALDTEEPACCSFHLMVLFPAPGGEFGQDCALISYSGAPGFGGLHMADTVSAYDPARGLSLAVPVIIFNGEGYDPDTLNLLINQSTSTVTAQLGSRAEPPMGDSK